MKTKTPEPIPGGFVENEWYEQVERIMRNDPRRFFLFSPATKFALACYLDLKEKHLAQRRHAA